MPWIKGDAHPTAHTSPLKVKNCRDVLLHDHFRRTPVMAALLEEQNARDTNDKNQRNQPDDF